MLLVLFKRFFGRHGSAQAPPEDRQETPEMMVERIRAGEMSRDELIAAYEPFIAKATSRFCKRYIDPSRDDEFSIALAAFDEAISQYASHAGKSFLGFAETVIRRRLIDYVRKEQRHLNSIPSSAFDATDDEDQTINPIETREAMQRYDADMEAEARRLEIDEYNSALGRFEISFSELPELSPKHSDSRRMLIAISLQLATAPHLFESLQATGRLPVKELCEMAGVSRKTIERNRKYLIAIAILHNGDYPCLQQYVKPAFAAGQEEKEQWEVRA